MGKINVFVIFCIIENPDYAINSYIASRESRPEAATGASGSSIAECYIAIFAMSHSGIAVPKPVFLELDESHPESHTALLCLLPCQEIGPRLV